MAPSMRAVRVHVPGGLDSIVVDEVQIPEPRPGWLLVKMEAAGLNFSDTVRRQDNYGTTTFPFTFGSEAAGPVVALGEGVEGLNLGDRVAGVIPGRGGGYADYVQMSAAHIVRIPDGMTSVDAVAVPNQGATAWCLLHDMARLAPGERVLIDAAGGGVGLWAIQLARAHGAGFIGAVTSGADKQAAALAAGADGAFAPDDRDWPDKIKASVCGFDVFLDSVGGKLFADGLNLLGPFGRAVCYGLSSGERVSVTPSADLVMACRSVAGFHLDQVMADPPRFRAVLDELFGLIAAGRIASRIAATFPLEKARDAQAFLESRKACGKVVLTA